MTQGSIDDANFAALSGSMETAGSTSAAATKSLESTIKTECDALISAVNALTSATNYSAIVNQLKEITDALNALNKED